MQSRSPRPHASPSSSRRQLRHQRSCASASPSLIRRYVHHSSLTLTHSGSCKRVLTISLVLRACATLQQPQPESGESVAIIQPIRAPRGPEAGKAWAFVRSVTCPLVKQAEVVEPEVVTPEPSVAEAPAASSASDSPVAVPDAVASTSTESTSAPVDATATPPPAVAASSTDDATVPPAEQTQPLSATEQ